MTDARTPDERFHALVDEFVGRSRSGQGPSVESYAAAHPDLAAEIRRVFPSLMTEAYRAASGDVTGDFEASAAVVRGATLERLGDFRVLREAGRGGMGVVYEAEQESLGRRVALKVLSSHAVSDPSQVKRFEREARAAAQLHHTNIVQVFGLGEQNALHYYAMQFIRGHGIDVVIEEIKRLRSADGIARSLVNEPFAPGLSGETGSSATQPARPVGSPVAPASPRPIAETPDPTPVAALDASGLSAALGTEPRYWRGVARVGLQVAGALEYAHDQGIFHRDIKPSNLILDAQGTAWVADFGLAKAVEGDDLTHTGNIVGTIRYMAPERFHGRCDARSDIYALGLTLYEMLALRPAFDGTSRLSLIHQVMEEEPTRLRKLDATIPRDLESVVQKAMARDPSARYATAGALAEDLALFLDGRPVLARDIGLLERGWKWACRRPAIAALLIGLAGSLAMGLAAVTWEWLAAVAARDEARGNLELASGAVNRYFTTVSQEDLLDEPGMQPLRARLLKDAIPYYRAFAARGTNVASLKADLATANLNLGIIDGELGWEEEGRANLEMAIRQFGRLNGLDPEDVDVRRGLARGYQALAELSLVDGYGSASRAAELWAKIARSRPDDPRAREMLGRSHDLAGVGACLKSMGVESKRSSREAIKVLTEALEAFPSDAKIRRRLAVALLNLGNVALKKGEPDDFLPALARSRQLFEALLKDQPASIVLRKNLLASLRNLGLGHLLLGAHQAAEVELAEALRLASRMVEQNPAVVDLRDRELEVHGFLAIVRMNQGRTALARSLVEKAIRLAREAIRPGNSDGLLNLGQSLLTRSMIESETGRRDLAEKSCGEALALVEKVFGDTQDQENERAYSGLVMDREFLKVRPGSKSPDQIDFFLASFRRLELVARKYPSDDFLRNQVIGGYLASAQLFASSEEPGLALNSLEKAAGLLPPDRESDEDGFDSRSLRARIEMARADAANQLGKPTEAGPLDDRAVAIAEGHAIADPAYLYDLACALALRARLDPKDFGPADSAVAALRKAVEAGFDNVSKLETDEYLATIRPRDDFQELIRLARGNSFRPL